MKIMYLYPALFVIIAFIAIGCDDGDSPPTPTQTLAGTKWKLVGIMDAQTDSLTELEPKECEECYTLTFDTDSTFSSYSSVNYSLPGFATYACNHESHSFRITDNAYTAILERGDGELWWEILDAVNSFSLSENELRLYYNENKNYLFLISQ